MESALFYDDPTAENIKRCKLVASAYMMSPGIAFILAGDEMGRTKYGNENSYNSPSKLNQIVWSRQQTFSSLYNFYKELIKMRKDNSAALFSYSKSTSASYCYGNFNNHDATYTTGYIDFTRGSLTLKLNGKTLTGTVKIGTKTLTI